MDVPNDFFNLWHAQKDFGSLLSSFDSLLDSFDRLLGLDFTSLIGL